MFSGVWEGKEIAYYENPDKMILTIIYDRKGDQPAWMILLMTRFFTVKGNASNFNTEFPGNSILIDKHTSTFKGSYLAITTDPVYVKFTPRNLINETEKLSADLENKAIEARRLSNNYQIDLVDLRHASEEVIREVFGEPLALPTSIVRKPGPGTVSQVVTGELHLGLDNEGEKAKEQIQSVLLTTIIGAQEEGRRIAQVILEDCILNGVSSVVFDVNETYSEIETPNSDITEYETYGITVDPIGLPVRKFIPGTDMFVDLTLLDGKIFSDIIGIGNPKTVDLINQVLSTNKLTNLKQLIDELATHRSEEGKYFAARGIRALKLTNSLYPNIFSGHVEVKDLIAPWLKKMGRISLVDLKGVNSFIVKGMIYTVLRTLRDHYKDELATNKLKVEILIEYPEVVSGRGGTLEKEISSISKECTDLGVGLIVLTDNELDVSKELSDMSTLKIVIEKENEVTVVEHSKNPYRAYIRPTLSKVKNATKPAPVAAPAAPAPAPPPAPAAPEQK